MPHDLPPGVTRGPDGQFRSADEFEDADPATFVGGLELGIAAGDITTGDDAFEVFGDEVTIIDFGNGMESDEVFVTHSVEIATAVFPAQTATAEHQYAWNWLLTSDAGSLVPNIALQSVSETANNVNITRDNEREDSALIAGFAAGTGDFADTATGVGGGAFNATAVQRRVFPQEHVPAPLYDADDELVLPSRLVALGSDDQGVNFNAACRVSGQIVDT